MISFITPTDIYSRLKLVADPELDIDIVSLGLIYDVKVEYPAIDAIRLVNKATKSDQKPPSPVVLITMTLTTPGCPLAGVFDQLVKNSLVGLPDLDPDHDVIINLTFDPPWVADMMSPEARAQLGFD